MLSESERKILDIVSKQLLITKGEIAAKLGKSHLDGDSTVLNRLVELGYVEKVESLGTCFVVTQAGIRASNGE
jgi:hypothetical protein